MENTKFEWITIESKRSGYAGPKTEYAIVPGGTLYRTIIYATGPLFIPVSVSMVFVPK